jgi:hypothetical protein
MFFLFLISDGCYCDVFNFTNLFLCHVNFVNPIHYLSYLRHSIFIKKFHWGYFISFMFLLNFLYMWNTGIIHASMFLSANSNIWSDQGWLWMIFLITLVYVCLFPCMTSNVWLDDRHCDFILLGAWCFIFLSLFFKAGSFFVA